MDRKWVQILVILMFHLGAVVSKVIKEGASVEIKCLPPETSTMVMWFRVRDKSDIEFIASFGSDGRLKTSSASFSTTFSDKTINQNILTLNSFSKASDSGLYTCARIKSNQLKFGEITKLEGEPEVKPVVPVVTTPQITTQITTTTPCVCTSKNQQVETSVPVVCPLIILGPLAGGCGLLLLLLIITVLYCNQIRTRRCPHHYKRKPRPTAPGKQMMTNRHI